MTTIDWLVESANFLAADRPDVYDKATAVEELSTSMDRLRHLDIIPVSSMMFTSYVLTRIVEEDVEEFMLSRKLSGVSLFEAEEMVVAISYHPEVNLPDVLDDPDFT